MQNYAVSITAHRIYGVHVDIKGHLFITKAQSELEAKGIGYEKAKTLFPQYTADVAVVVCPS